LIIKNLHGLLEYSIAFGQNELQAYQTEKGLTDTKNEVVSSLFRSIIELSVGVKSVLKMVCVRLLN